MYDLKSKFDINEHQTHYINYLEVMILKDGTVEYAIPSHQEKAIVLACKELNMTRAELEDLCPRVYFCDFLTWLLGITGTVAVCDNGIVYKTINRRQITALTALKMKKLYKGQIPRKEIL